MTTSTPYDETVIVDLIHEMYRLLIIFGSLEPDEVKWPLPEGHAINETLCQESNLDSAVVSLMKKLLYPRIDPGGGLDHTIYIYIQ
jgi:hypothetical protein